MINIWQQVTGLSHAAKAGIMVAVIILAVALAMGTGYFMIIRASNSAASARAIAVGARANQHDLCVAADKADAKQVLLWNYLLQLAPPQNLQQKNVDQQFKAFIAQVFRSQPCPPAP